MKNTAFLSDVKLGLAGIAILGVGQIWGINQFLIKNLEKVSLPAMMFVEQRVSAISQPLQVLKQTFHAAERVKELEAQYTQSLAEISELEYLKVENQELREILDSEQSALAEQGGSGESGSGESELGEESNTGGEGSSGGGEGRIIAAPIVSHGQSAIGVGEEQGIQVGQSVLASKLLVGVISETSAHQAIVQLLFQSQTQPILAKTQGGVEGLIVGNGRNILLTEIPQEEPLRVGERVVTIGQASIRPQLLIGEVAQIIEQASAPIKSAVIYQPTSFYSATLVEVLQ